MKTSFSVLRSALVLGASAAALAIAAGGISDAELAALDRACAIPVRVEYKDGWFGTTRVATCDRMRRAEAPAKTAAKAPGVLSDDGKYLISPEPFDWRAAQNAGR